MKFLAPSLLFLAATAYVQAETKYYGVYSRDIRTGYTSDESREDKYKGKPAIRISGRWVNTTSIGGVKTKSVVETTTWSTPDHRPLKEVTKVVDEGGATVTTTVFGEKKAEADVLEKGKTTHYSVRLPEGEITCDIVATIHDKAPKPGDKLTLWSYETFGHSFAKIEVQNIGPSSFMRDGKKVEAILAEGAAQGSTLRYFIDASGNLLREEFPFGMILQTETKEVALAPLEKEVELPDALEMTSLKMDGAVEDALHLSRMKIRVLGPDLSKIPSDSNQTVTQDGKAWLIDVHPARISESAPSSILDAATGNEKWLRPAKYLTSDDPKIVSLAKKITQKSKDVVSAAIAVRTYVNKAMKPEMVLGLARDASEILNDKRGKCTDYSILTGALLRAAGIPSRICSGLITGSDTFYYHAWNEFWDGKRWVEIDSVFDEGSFSACHIKLAQGDAEEGFNINYLNPATSQIKLLAAEH